jgi:hypothetical protein
MLVHLRVVVAALEQVRHPERQAVDDDRGAVLDLSERGTELERLLDRVPLRRTLCAVQPDSLGHLLVARLGRRDDHHGAAAPPREVDGQRRLAAASAA